MEDPAVILPFPAKGWSRDHLRLHRHLRRRPDLLPENEQVLIAVSGGQDSMALVGLLQDLQRLHHWRLVLWHGDHGWRADSSTQAAELQDWARQRQLSIRLSQAARPIATEGEGRRWRYACLAQLAADLNCRCVVTAHTASDRAETVLLNLARGSHRRGVASLRASRSFPVPPAPAGCRLVRPLLPFCRTDTERICGDLGLPIWVDPTNLDLRFHRNRIRAEVVPVLEDLHPGACRRISAQAERVAEEVDRSEELVELALEALRPSSPGPALSRPALVTCSPALQRQLLQHWLTRVCGHRLASRPLEELLTRIQIERGPGQWKLPGEWQLQWNRDTLRLCAHDEQHD